MNCDAYREAIAVDPSASVDGGTHISGCEACSRYTAEMRTLDECIARALGIDVPDPKSPDLPHIAAATGEPVALVNRGSRSRIMSPPRWAGLVAAVALLAVLFTILPNVRDQRGRLVDEIIAHMDHEEASRQVTSIAVPPQRLHAVVDRKVAAMDHDIGLITYAMSCVINGRIVPHLVIQGSKGPVTLILLAEETVESPISLTGKNVYGVLLPVGRGSIAVIGQREDQLEEIDRIGSELADSVEWNI